jgi:hypothetical protein
VDARRDDVIRIRQAESEQDIAHVRRLLQALIREARSIGYFAMRLDSTRFMEQAHALYGWAGCEQIDEYPESEIPSQPRPTAPPNYGGMLRDGDCSSRSTGDASQYRKHWVFMEKRLQDEPEAAANAQRREVSHDG